MNGKNSVLLALAGAVLIAALDVIDPLCEPVQGTAS
jgi:hypothetical protein